MLLGSGPKTLQVRAAEGTVRVPANDVQRLLPGVEKLRIETVDEGALERAIDDGADVSLGDIDPDQAVRLVGSSSLFGQSTEVAVIAETASWTTGQIRIVPRDIRLGVAEHPGPAGGHPAVAAAAVHPAHRPGLAAPAGHPDQGCGRPRTARWRSAAGPAT